MGKSLVIVESPAKCKKIEQYLGSEYKCIASYSYFTAMYSYVIACLIHVYKFSQKNTSKKKFFRQNRHS